MNNATYGWMMGAGLFVLSACGEPESGSAKGPPDIVGVMTAVKANEASAPEAGRAPEDPTGVIAAIPMPAAPLNLDATLDKIVFASCADQLEDQAIWNTIAGENHDLTLFIGDNVYGDVRSGDPALPELKAAYMRLAQSAPFARVRATAPMLTMWDDHDYGLNDRGGGYPFKEQSEALYEYVWALPENDPRRDYPGVYGAWRIGSEAGRRIQLIMLDTRYFRSELKETDDYGAPGKERYIPDPDPAKTMLGEAQWRWLEKELRKDADLRLIVSSVQIIADGHGWEAWKMLPTERQRLYDLIGATEAEGVVLLSGDRHSAALYKRDGVIDYPLYEATSSSLNLPSARWREEGDTYQEPGPNRLGDMYTQANYGVIEIDWEGGALTLSIRDGDGTAVREQTIELAELRVVE